MHRRDKCVLVLILGGRKGFKLRFTDQTNVNSFWFYMSTHFDFTWQLHFAFSKDRRHFAFLKVEIECTKLFFVLLHSYFCTKTLFFVIVHSQFFILKRGKKNMSVSLRCDSPRKHTCLCSKTQTQTHTDAHGLYCECMKTCWAPPLYPEQGPEKIHQLDTDANSRHEVHGSLQ